MKPQVRIRELTADERRTLERGLRWSESFVLRRSQILLASARGEGVPQIARGLSCDEQTVRTAIQAFNREGVAALQVRSSRRLRTREAFDDQAAEELKALLHQSPRAYGKPTSVWTLALAAEVSDEQGLTEAWVSDETIRRTITRLGWSWKRAKHWITSPDPDYEAKKRRDRLVGMAHHHPDWVLGFSDEVWWSRLSHPRLPTWGGPDQPLRLLEQRLPKDDPDPKALAGYGGFLSCPAEPPSFREQVWRRFVTGRPVSAITTQFLDWAATKLAAFGKRVWLLVWDNASWHRSQQVRAWIRTHHRQVKRSDQGVRILACFLASKSPWLNPIEPRWRHSRRRVLEPNRSLSAAELEQRVCEALGCQREPRLALPDKVA